ncbi:MAG: AAA family ATPase [Myxococcales bacterium]|nr:AAA family ATPase [Myxococcales bacterium]
MPHSAEVQQVYAQASDIAQQTGQRLSSAHVLLAMFTVPNLAELLLLERDVNEETLLACIERIEHEPDDTLPTLAARSREIARACEDDEVNCLHLLAAVTSQPHSFAWQVLARTGVAMEQLAEAAQRYATHGVPRRLRRTGTALALDDLEVRERDTMEYAALATVEAERDTVNEQVEAPTPTVEAPSVRRGASGRYAAVEPPAWGRVAAEPTDRRSGQRGRRAADHSGQTTGGRREADVAEAAEATPAETATPIDATPIDLAADAPLDEDRPSPFVLNRERFPWLTRLGRNLSHLAWLGRFDPVFGRDREIDETLDVLHKRRSNNPCLVGEPGVGKTAIAEGVATRLAKAHGDARTAPERVIIQIDVGGILAGTHLRGALAERLRGLQDEVRQARGRVVVFIDEVHTLMGAGGGDGAHDAANELKAALARGEFPVIGATTVDEYRTHIEADPAMERRFTPVFIDEPDEPTTLRILHGVADRYARHHHVAYQPDAIDAAARLARRYLHDRADPDKSLGVLDLAGAVARRRGGAVDRRAVAEVISRMARVPVEHLLVDDPERFLQMEALLGEQLIGQRHVLTAIAETIRRNLAGFAGGRPIGSFLFLGPTGVGKTEAVKALAAFLFGSRDALVRFDMSEYLEAHAVARLIGAPPGYVGHAEGGQLTDRVRRRPYQVVLFDEIEKSHRDVWNVLLQVLDDGRLTDGKGRTVDFSNTVVVMTSNLGAEVFRDSGRRIGFGGVGAGDREAQTTQALDAARRAFPPELWGRIERRLVFHPLSRDEVAAVARLQLAERARLLEGERGIRFSVSDAAVDLLIARGGYDLSLGARPMRRTIARDIEGPLAERILAGRLRRGDVVRIDAVEGELTFTAAEPA